MPLWSGWAWGALAGLVAFAVTSLLWLAHDLGGMPWRDVPRPLQAKLLAPIWRNLGIFLIASGLVASLVYVAVSKLHAGAAIGTISVPILPIVAIALPSRRRRGMTESWSDPAFSAASDAVNHQ